jgi:HD superfamily phosphohydrolase YqeK
VEDVTPTELRAAAGELPDWARVSPRRREHIARVAALMEQWARDLGLEDAEVLRWAAAAWLHDSLRDADPAELVHQVGPEDRDYPPRALHGPAAAGRLAGEVDPRVANAVRYHTVGHPGLDDLGRALYLADFLEPGRDFLDGWRAGLRSRMPAELRQVLVEVLGARLAHLVEQRMSIRPETAAFWNSALAEAKE